MRRAALFSCLLAGLLAAGTPLAAADPRPEQKRLTAADQALARKAIVKRSDLVAGWRRATVPAGEASDEACPGFDPDLSAFTITGEAMSIFQYSGAMIMSKVDVYATKRDAEGAFRAEAKPAAARCLRQAIIDGFAGDRRVQFTVLSSRMVSAPRTGDRSVAYRLVGRMQTGTQRMPLYVDLLAFRKGRSVGAVYFSFPGAPLRDRILMARLVAGRLR